MRHDPKYSRPAPLPVLAAEQERSRKLTWSDALRVSFGVDALTCECGGKRRLIAVITQPTVIKKILAHLGLPTEVAAAPGPRTRVPTSNAVSEPPLNVAARAGAGRACLPEDQGETGQDLDLSVDEDFGVDFVDELPADDLAA